MLVRVVSLVCLCLLAQACSDGRPPMYMERTAATNAGNTAAKPGRVVLEDKNLTNEEIRQAFAQGYKPVERHGEVYYCRREQETGSRFETTTCRTGDEMKRLTQASKDALTELQGTGGCRHEGPGC
jgi:hypothetical protein